MKIILNQKIEDSFFFYFLLLLPCLNFLGRGSIFCLIFACFTLIRIPLAIKLDGNFFCSLLLTFSMAIASLVFYDLSEAIKAFNYILMYLIGYCVFFVAKDKEKLIKRIFFTIFFGFLIHVVLLYVYNLNLETEYQRTLYSIWTGQLVAVTLVALLSSVTIGYAFYAIVLHKKKAMKLAGITSIIFMMLINNQTATRTPFILFFIIFIFMFFIYIQGMENRKKVRRIVWGTIIIIAIVVIYQNDLWGIKTYILSSPIVERFAEEGMDTSRMEIASYHFKHMFDSLFGGQKISKVYGHLAHNFIQEAHDKYGIFATIALIGLAINILANIFKLLFLKRKLATDFLFISMYISIMIQICLEPVFDGYPVIIMILLLIHGLASARLASRLNAQGVK